MEFRSIYQHGFVRVAACTGRVAIADPPVNAELVLRSARECSEEGVVVALFPEMTLTGYAIEDLVLQDAVLDDVERSLATVVEGSVDVLPLLVFGAPLRHRNRVYNCAVVVHRGRVLGVVPKSYPPTYREFYERRQIAAGDDTGGAIRVGGADVPFGPDLLFDAEDVPGLVVTRDELAALVELPVGRHVRLRRHAEDAALVHDDRAVVEPVAVAQRSADHEHRQEVRRRLDDARERDLDLVEHRVLEQQVLDRVPGQAQLREDRDRDALGGALARLADHRFGVGGRVGDRHPRGAGGDAGEAVGVGVAEVGHPGAPVPSHASTNSRTSGAAGSWNSSVRRQATAVGWARPSTWASTTDWPAAASSGS